MVDSHIVREWITHGFWAVASELAGLSSSDAGTYAIAWIAIQAHPSDERTSVCGANEASLEGLITLIEHLHALGIRIAIPLAGLLYMVAGLYWMHGTVESQAFAKRLVLNTTTGLAIVLLSESIAEIVTQPLCGGGP